MFKKSVLLISIGLFAVSLSQEAYCTTNLCRPSFDALITGALGFLYGGAAITWLANPILFISWISINKNLKLSFILSFLAAVISLAFLFFSKVIDNEAGHVNSIISYKLGYWLWLSSSITMLIGNTILILSKKLQSANIRNI